MITKEPTPQGISALLKRAGFERSTSSPSRIKGWRNYTAGYQVNARYPSGAEVTHRVGFDRGPRADAERARMLAAYAEAIRAAGWHVVTTSRPRLIVSAPPEQED